MDAGQIVNYFTDLVEQSTNVLPTVTAEDVQAADRLSQIEGGEDVLAVVMKWPDFCAWLVDKGRASFPPRRPHLPFIAWHYLSVSEYLRGEGLYDSKPPRCAAPIGTVDAVTGSPVIDGSPSPNAIAV